MTREKQQKKTGPPDWTLPLLGGSKLAAQLAPPPRRKSSRQNGFLIL